MPTERVRRSPPDAKQSSDYAQWTSDQLLDALPVTGDKPMFEELLRRFTVTNPFVADADLPMRDADVSNDQWTEFVSVCGLALRESHDASLRTSILYFFSFSVPDVSIVSEDLIVCLDDQDDHIRRLAIQVMQSPLFNPDPLFIPPLVRALQHSDPETRYAATVALGGFGAAAESTVPDLAEALDDDTGSVRFGAADALAAIGPKSAVAVPALIGNLQHPHEPARYSAAAALGEIGADPDRSVPALIQSLRDPASMVRGNAAEALGKLKAQPAVSELMRLLNDPDSYPQRAAAEALGRIGPASSVALVPLMKMCDDPFDVNRAEAIEAVGFIGGDAGVVVPVLIKASRDTYWAARCAAIDALSRLYPSDTQAIAVVLRGLSDDNEYVVEHSVKALASIGPAAISAEYTLRDLVKHSRWRLQAEAQRALDRIELEKRRRVAEAQRQLSQPG